MRTTGKVETWLLFSSGSEKPSQSCRFGIHISTAVGGGSTTWPLLPGRELPHSPSIVVL